MRIQPILTSGTLTNQGDVLGVGCSLHKRAAFELGTFTGTITFQGTVDSSGTPTWVTIAAHSAAVALGGTTVGTATGTGVFHADVTPYAAVRVIFTTKTTGTPTVKILISEPYSS